MNLPKVPELFDTHAHLADEQFVGRVDEILTRAAQAGVRRLLAVATTLAASRACIDLAAAHAGVWASVGIHPNYVVEAGSGDWDQVVRWTDEPRVVALGETGLDRHWDFAPFALQQEYFARHLELSRRTQLPFIVHMRDCQADVLRMLRDAHRCGPLCGIMHSFVGSAEAAAECIEMGLHVSFAGMVTYKKSDDLRQVASSVPAERLLIETDSPYLSPHPLRGQRPNEPALVVHTAACLAEVRGVSVAELARQTTANAVELLGVK